MGMIKSRSYKGIRFINLDDLPEEQCLLLLEWINKSNVIAIQIEGVVLSRCVQYTDYSFWYKTVFSPVATENKKPSRGNNSKFGLAFNNK